MNIENLALGYVKTAPSPATTGTSLTLETDEGARFPATTTASFYVTLMPADANPHSENAEVVEVTDRTGDVLTIVRGQRGTTGQSVDVGWIVLNSFYKEDIEALQGASYVQNEIPTGDVDGVNDDFELSNTPVSNSLQLYLNGIRQKETDDYTISGTTITFVSAPEVDDKITADYLVNAGTFIGSNSFIYNEVPSGTIDGVNDDFTLANTPVTDTLQLFRDGQLLKGGGVDYTLTDDDIAFTTAPEVDSILLAHYQKSVASSGNADTLDGLHAVDYADEGKLVPYRGGWQKVNATWTFSSVDDPTGVISFANADDYLSEGMRVQFTNATNTIYGIVTAVTSTTFTFLHEIDPTDSQALYLMADSAITNPMLSHNKAPQGFPLSPDKWSILDSIAYSSTLAPDNNVTLKTSSVPIGSWNIESIIIESKIFISAFGDVAQIDLYINTDESANGGGDYGRFIQYINVQQVRRNIFSSIVKYGVTNLSSKTSFYTRAYLYHLGTTSNFIVNGKFRATCAYL